MWKKSQVIKKMWTSEVKNFVWKFDRKKSLNWRDKKKPRSNILDIDRLADIIRAYGLSCWVSAYRIFSNLSHNVQLIYCPIVEETMLLKDFYRKVILSEEFPNITMLFGTHNVRYQFFSSIYQRQHIRENWERYCW